IGTRYDDVCVQQDIIDELHSGIVLPLKGSGSAVQASDGLEGYLLYGPPGTGKTMLCRALARESGVRLILIRPSDVQSHLVGVSEKLIRCVFALARLIRPCIIVVDEPDALFGRRGGSGNSERWLRSMLVEFMQEMDGLTAGTNNAKIVLIGATNRPYDIDDAVLRRLPHRILVDLPGRPQREDILRHNLKGKQADETVDVPRLAERTMHYSGSDLKHLVRFAAQVALKDALQ
ncbi:AAA ATPase, partial [Auricularia subglabra TFB-10046 SS5]